MRNRTIYINTSLPEDIKLRTVKTEYIVNEKKRTVAAILTWDVRYSDGSRLCEIVWSLNHRTRLKNGWKDRFSSLIEQSQTARGVAKAGPDDQFDIKKGKRIALARAEVQAYNQVVKELSELQREISFVVDEIEVFKDRAENVREGNKEFIQKVDSGEIN